MRRYQVAIFLRGDCSAPLFRSEIEAPDLAEALRLLGALGWTGEDKGSSIERIDAEPPQPTLYDLKREETLRLAREVLACSIPDGEGRQGILWAKRFANELLSASSAKRDSQP